MKQKNKEISKLYEKLGLTMLQMNKDLKEIDKLIKEGRR